MSKIYIVYSSLNKEGITSEIAEIMHQTINEAPNFSCELFLLDKEETYNIDQLDDADMIIFGTPTYMGSVYSEVKKFMEKSSGKWFQGKWRNKLAAGFTNSSHTSGDKLCTLEQLVVFAAQHGMIWVPLGIPSALTSGDFEKNLNQYGSSLGLMTQVKARKATTDNQFKDKYIDEGDKLTAKVFAQRLVDVTNMFKVGQLNSTKAAQ